MANEALRRDSGDPKGPLTCSFFGADDGIRTRDPHLGKVMLYQLSHVRVCEASLASPSGPPLVLPSPERNNGWNEDPTHPATRTDSGT
jgi:hypothetical protein